MTFFASICFIVCHGGPADHFAAFADRLAREQIPVSLYASGSAFAKLQGRAGMVSPFSLENLSDEKQKRLADELAERCSQMSVVVTDVGHSFDVLMHKALEKRQIAHFAYYDNPESYVPGGYSETAAKVMQAAQKTLFANASLAKAADQVGIGYYPIEQAEKIVEKRAKERSLKRAELGVRDDQKVLVYFGGNNQEYFEKAFPAFLRCVKERREDWVVCLQQHPGAKAENRDGKQLGADMSHVRFLQGSSEEALVVADAALYYQTSMGPLFVLAGIPVVQVGHEVYEDVLVRNKICPSVINKEAFARAIDAIQPDPVPKEAVYRGLGIREDWFQQLKLALDIRS